MLLCVWKRCHIHHSQPKELFSTQFPTAQLHQIIAALYDAHDNATANDYHEDVPTNFAELKAFLNTQFWSELEQISGATRDSICYIVIFFLADLLSSVNFNPGKAFLI